LLALAACGGGSVPGPGDAQGAEVGRGDVRADVRPDLPPPPGDDGGTDAPGGLDVRPADLGPDLPPPPADGGPDGAGPDDPDAAALDAVAAADGGDAPDGQGGPATLRLMTFNLRTLMAADGDDAWPNRQELVVDVIRAAAPDVLGIQEGWKAQVDHVARRLPEYRWAGVSRRGNDVDEYCAVLWRGDRFERLEDGTFWLSDAPDTPATYFSDAQCCPRIVTWVRLRPLGGGAPFLVLNTHFDTIDQDDVPARSAALLARRAAALAGAGPVFALGDFNDAPGDRAWRILTGAETFDDGTREGVRGDFLDPWLTLGLPEAGTFHGFDGTAPGARIDWVLHAGPGFAPTAAAIDRTAADGRYPSDHFPVWVDFARAP
jgi:endonuclease/exonuclease/phosphatase family metal-dependent hydrolase